MEKYAKQVEVIIPLINAVNEKYYKTADGKFLTAPDGKWILKETVTVEDYQKDLGEILNEMVEFKL